MADSTNLDALLHHDRYPRSAGYDATWVMANQMGPHALWLTEWLAEEMDLQPGMRVLGMGCGKALSSILLAREFGVRVWANDLWIPASENWERIREAGLADQIVPIQAEAHALPYAQAFFDAAISIDSFHYYGTDDLYLNYFARFIRPGGQIGVAVPGLMQPIVGEPPAHLTTPQRNGVVFWEDELWTLQTVAEWRRRWEHSSLVAIERADAQPDGCDDWLRFERACEAADALIFPSVAETLERDRGAYLGFVRLVARRSDPVSA